MHVWTATIALVLSVGALAQQPGPPAREVPAGFKDSSLPPPREFHVDRNGYTLPPGAVGRLGVPPALSGFAWNIGWTADGKKFAVVDWAGITLFDAATGHVVESQSLGTAHKNQYTPLSRDGRLLFLLDGQRGLLYDTSSADVRTFTLPKPFADPELRIYSMSLSANCRFLAGIAGQSSRPGVAWLYDLARDEFKRVILNRADVQSALCRPTAGACTRLAARANPS